MKVASLKKHSVLRQKKVSAKVALSAKHREKEQLERRKRKKVRLNLTNYDWLRLHESCRKFPLSMRVAKDLFEGGVTTKMFNTKFHIEDSGFSTAVSQAIEQFELGKGFDPEFVPGVMPVVVTATPKPAEEAKGRPSKDQATKRIAEFFDKLKQLGWEKQDIRLGTQAWLGEKPVVVREVKIEEPIEELPATKVVCVKLPNGKPAECEFCSFPLGDSFVGREFSGEVSFSHYGCHTLNLSTDADLVEGQRAFSTIAGFDYFYSKKKAKWVPKDEYDKATQAKAVEAKTVSTP